MAEREKLPDLDNNDQTQDFFKTLSFYDDDPIDLPFESFFEVDPSLSLPQPEAGPDVSGSEIADTVIENVLETVIEQGVLPRKVATVHPFSLNNTENAPKTEPPSDPPVGLRLAKFAVDPATSSSSSSSSLSEPTS